MKHARKRGKGGGYGIYPYHVNRVTVAHIYTIAYFLILPGGYMWPSVRPIEIWKCKYVRLVVYKGFLAYFIYIYICTLLFFLNVELIEICKIFPLFTNICCKDLYTYLFIYLFIYIASLFFTCLNQNNGSPIGKGEVQIIYIYIYIY
jgi:hypothetical protein